MAPVKDLTLNDLLDRWAAEQQLTKDLPMVVVRRHIGEVWGSLTDPEKLHLATRGAALLVGEKARSLPTATNRSRSLSVVKDPKAVALAATIERFRPLYEIGVPWQGRKVQLVDAPINAIKSYHKRVTSLERTSRVQKEVLQRAIELCQYEKVNRVGDLSDESKQVLTAKAVAWRE